MSKRPVIRKNFVIISPWGLPLFNTFLLLSSGVTVTWAHKVLSTSRKIKEFEPTVLQFVFLIVLEIKAKNNRFFAFISPGFKYETFLKEKWYQYKARDRITEALC